MVFRGGMAFKGRGKAKEIEKEKPKKGVASWEKTRLWKQSLDKQVRSG